MMSGKVDFCGCVPDAIMVTFLNALRTHYSPVEKIK